MKAVLAQLRCFSALMIGAGCVACSSTASTPLGAVVVNPTSLTLTCANPKQAFTVSQAGYAGPFSVTSQNTMVATVAPTSPPNTFLVSAGTTFAMTTISVIGACQGTACTAAMTPVSVTNVACPCVRHRDMWTNSGGVSGNALALRRFHQRI